jgi:hypothetical protein
MPPLRRGLFFVLWIVLFASFYLDHHLEKEGLRSSLEDCVSYTIAVTYFGLWVWTGIYRKAEAELALLSAVFLILFFCMCIWDAPITE